MDDQIILEGEALEAAVRTLDLAWAVLPGMGLVRVIPLPDFATGVMVLNKVASAIDTPGHEPDLTLRRHEVEIVIPAYEHGGTTKADISLAAKFDQLLK